MESSKIVNCQRCDQKLSIPTGIGGMLMACPSCGHQFHTDFRLAKTKSSGTSSQTRPGLGKLSLYA